MPDRTPGEIRIHRRALTILRRILSAAQPEEGCALLLGCTTTAPLPATRATRPTPHAAMGDSAGSAPASLGWEIRLIWPCLNVWQPVEERRTRFALDPREQLLAQRWSRERDLQVLGAAHSHPGSPAVPSRTDLSLAVAPCLQLILSPLEGWSPACWWLELTPQGEATPRRLRWRMVD